MVRDVASGQLMYVNEDDKEPGGLDENPEDVAETDAFKDVVKDAITQLSQREQLFMALFYHCLLYTSPSPRDATLSRMPSSA